MTPENNELLKSMVKPLNVARFVRYFDKQLWYQIQAGLKDVGPEFPVPIEDVGTATFLATDRAPLFMRYIRKHFEMLEKAKVDLYEF